MPAKGSNHQHRQSSPSQNTEAPNQSADDRAPGPSGQGTQEQDVKRRQGQFGGAGDPPLIKK